MEHILSLASHHTLVFLALISVVVFVHEFGHYWVARRCGVKIEVFSIGFGPEIFGWNDKRGTRWKVSWLPLGGYVKMFGDGSAASTPGDGVHTMSDEEKKVAFFHQHVDKRMAVVVAGPAFNYLFAILVLALLFMFQGEPYTPPDVGGLIVGGAAASSGIKEGDHILSVDGNPVERFQDIQRIVLLNGGTPLPVTLKRDNETLAITLTPKIVSMTDRFGEEHKVPQLGIKSLDKFEYVKRPPVAAVKQAFIETWDLSASMLKGIGQIITGTRGADELGGPLRIAQMAGNIATEGVGPFIWFMAVISINLGLINLFPVPLLDGGHLAFYLAEKLRGRPLHDSIQEVGMRVGMILVVTLMVFATWNDLVHLKVISYLRHLFS
jgi:regulator of sigma E protease